MSNLIKSNYIYVNRQNTRVIDSNKKSEEIKSKDIKNKDIMQGVSENKEKEFVEGIPVINMEQLLEDEENLMVQKSEGIILEAKEKAEKIIKEAKQEAEIYKQNIFEDAKQSGYAEGYNIGIAESKMLEEKLRNQIHENQLLYEKQVCELEPEFVKVIIELIKKITGVEMEDRKEVILHLIDSALRKVENSRNFLIKVSKEDYDFVVSKKDDLYTALKDGVYLEIIEDLTLSKNKCLIETDLRIIDCSLDVQMNGLIADLKLLANV